MAVGSALLAVTAGAQTSSPTGIDAGMEGGTGPDAEVPSDTWAASAADGSVTSSMEDAPGDAPGVAPAEQALVDAVVEDGGAPGAVVRPAPHGVVFVGTIALGGGVFRMGGRVVGLGSYAIDRTEVTAGRWRACVAGGGCEALYDPWRQRVDDRAPVAGVTWAQAARFCTWAGGRLPTEAEWEFAARGIDGRRYPWGESLPDCAHARLAGCGDGPGLTGALPAGRGPSGALDLAGNLAEWVVDRYGPLPSSGYVRDPEGPARGDTRVVRGGSFVSSPEEVTATARAGVDPREGRYDVGFRCARRL